MAMTPEEAQDFRESALLLSANELKGMLGGEPEEDAIINSILNKGDAVEVPGLPDVESGDPDEEDPDEEEEEEAEPEPEPVPEPEPTPEPQPEPEPAPAANPDFVAPALDLSHLNGELADGIKAIDARRAEATQKLMDGEITPAEYAKIDSETLNERDALREELAIKKDWFKTVHDFRVQAAKTSGVNYFDDSEKFDAFDGWVQRLGANPKNADKPAEWFLAEAHKKVLVEFEITPPAAKTAQNGTKNVADAKKVAPKTVRTPNLSNIPPTLGGLPAAAPATGGDGGEFAHLEKLTGLDYERAIARMTPEQRDRWSQA